MKILLPILPEVMLLSVIVLVLIGDPFLKKEKRRSQFLGWFVIAGLLLTQAITMIFARPGDPELVYGGMIRFDWMGFLFKNLFLLAALATTVFFMKMENIGERAEAYVLLLAATLGMCLMATASDLIMLYLAIETTSIPLYILAGFLKDDKKSTESGFKYLLFGALTSAVLLYGLSLIYGFSGKTNLYELSLHFSNLNPLSLGVTFLVLAGLAFKVSLFPFHFWAPDVYEGSPTPVAGFLSTASKAAGFAMLIRLFTAVFPVLNADWSLILAVLATLTMTVGNLVALTQKNIKRMLAYSSIAHAGYAMIGAVAFSELGVASVIFYLVAYVLTNLVAFGTIAFVGQHTGSDEFPAYYGLSRRNPALALVLLVAFLSLAGMPPFAGFVAKFFVFAAAVQSGWIWLAIVGVLNSIVGLYYYLNVLKYIYLYRMEEEQEQDHPLPMSKMVNVVLGALVVGILILGVLFGPWFGMAAQAAANMF